MKLVAMWVLVASVVVCPGVNGSPAWAQDDNAGRRPPPSTDLIMRLRHHLLHRFDENGNRRLDHRESHHALQTVMGVLSRHRGRAIRISDLPAGLRPIFVLFDHNRDGLLGPVEQMGLSRTMPHAARVPHRPRPPQRPDTGTDRPDRPEKPRPPARPGGDGDAGDDGSQRPRPPRLTPELIDQLRNLLLQAFDRNNNHRLDPPERSHARRTLLGFLSRHRGTEIEVGATPPRLGRILGLFDFNGDGKLGPIEKRLLIQALKILLRPRPRPESGPPGGGDRPQRPRPDRPLGDDLDDCRPGDRPADGGFEVRPGRPPRPDF